MHIRQLTGDDAAAFRDLRLAGLQAHPDAFGASWEEEVQRPASWFAANLDRGFVLGCDVEGALAGVAGLQRNDRLKTRHRGVLWGMYVAPHARGHGVAAALVGAIVAEARRDLEELELGVGVDNQPAIRLYRSHGFVEWGVQPHALKIGEAYVEEMMMRLVL